MSKKARDIWERFQGGGKISIGRPSIWILVALAAVLSLCYYVRPWFHGLIIGLYRAPLVMMFLFAIFLFIMMNLFMYSQLEKTRNRDTARYERYQRIRKGLTALVVIFIIALVPL